MEICNDFVKRDFDTTEYLQRLGALMESIIHQDLDMLLVTSPEDIRWLTGYYTPGKPLEAVLLSRRMGLIWFMTRDMEASNAEALSWVKNIKVYVDTEDAIEKLARLIKGSMGYSDVRCGYQKHEHRMTSREKDNLILKCPELSWVDVSEIVENIRVVKSPAEQAFVKNAAEIMRKTMNYTVNNIRIGMTENELAYHALKYIISGDGGMRWPSYPPFVSFGPHSRRGHVTFEGRKIYGQTRVGDTLEDGQLVFLELGASYKGYHSAMMRTVFVGREMPQIIKEASDLIKEAVLEMVKHAKHGVTCEYVDKIGRDILNKRKFSATQKTKGGYSIGIGHPPDWADTYNYVLFEGNKRILKEGMVLHLIPYLQTEYGAIGNSMMVIIRNECAEMLYNHDLDVIHLKIN
jgi:Xaa-Pro dipeptidase